MAELKVALARVREQLRNAIDKLANLRERFPGAQKKAEKRETKRKIASRTQERDELKRRLERKEAQGSYRVIPRSAWGARPPRRKDGLASTANGVFIHHTVGAAPTTALAEVAEMRATQNFHMDTRGWNDIAYSFIVFPSGRIYEGRGKGVAGAHTEGYNSTSLAICGAGNYEVNQPTDAMIAAMRWTRRTYLGLGSAPLRGHRQVNQTACPGAKLFARLGDI